MRSSFHNSSFFNQCSFTTYFSLILVILNDVMTAQPLIEFIKLERVEGAVALAL